MAVLIPFSFLPPKTILAWANKLRSLGERITPIFPELREELMQAEIPVTAREYAAAALIAGFFNSLFLALMLTVISIAAKANFLGIIMLLAVVVFAITFLTIISYPKIQLAQKARKIDQKLLPALRQMLIEIRSGVPLFNSMVSVCDDYGSVSMEFRKIVKKINSGVSELDVLTDASRESPSKQFRKVLYQISNALKVGSDVGNALETMIDELTRERINAIHAYAQELSPWTMMYMLAAVIVPSLGLTMVIIIVSFLNVAIPNYILLFAIIGLLVFQLFFMNFVSMRRPTV